MWESKKVNVFQRIDIFKTSINLFLLLIYSLGISTILSKKSNPKEFKVEAIENEGFIPNVMKGYANFGNYREQHFFNYTLGFFFVKFADLMPIENYVNITWFNIQLDKFKNDGMQVVVRLALEMPPYKFYGDYLPEYISKRIKKFQYTYYIGNDPDNYSPDYNDEYLLGQLEILWRTIAENFDGDPRIAYMELGTYGHWGEWHVTCGPNIPEATDETLDRIMDMYVKNFNKTQVMVRRAAERNINRTIGIYNDMFCDDHHDISMMRDIIKYNQTERWKTQAMGGEESMDKQREIFINESIFNYYMYSLDFYHTSFLNSNIMLMHTDSWFETDPTWLRVKDDWIRRRHIAERKMGYNYYIKDGKVTFGTDFAYINLTIANKGVAPFYYPWPVHFALVSIDKKKDSVRILREDVCDIEDCSMKGILPNETKQWVYNMSNIGQIHPNECFALRIPSQTGLFVMMSNNEQRRDGWYIINLRTFS